MIDSQKTNFSKMALSLRQNNMNPNPLALFHDICRHIKCHLRNQNRQKFHFSNMGPHCETVFPSIFSYEFAFFFFCRTDHMRQYIVDHGYTVADIMDCSKGENHMCLIQMGSPEEAIKALAKLHNVNPEGYQTRNNAGLCFSFSGRKSTKSPNDD